MSNRIIHLLLALSLGLNAGVIATTLVHRVTAPSPGHPPGGGGVGDRPPAQSADPARMVDSHLRGMTRHLGLDEEQQRAVREVLERYVPELIELQTGAADAGEALASAFGAPEFDRETFLRLTAETSAARSRLDSLSAVLLMAEAELLTPEQRQLFSTVAPMVHSQPQQPAGRRGPPPDGGPPRDGGPPPPEEGRPPR